MESKDEWNFSWQRRAVGEGVGECEEGLKARGLGKSMVFFGEQSLNYLG